MSKRAIKLSGIITILRDGRGLIKHISDSVFISKYHLNGALDKDASFKIIIIQKISRFN